MILSKICYQANKSSIVILTSCNFLQRLIFVHRPTKRSARTTVRALINQISPASIAFVQTQSFLEKKSLDCIANSVSKFPLVYTYQHSLLYCYQYNLLYCYQHRLIYCLDQAYIFNFMLASDMYRLCTNYLHISELL